MREENEAGDGYVGKGIRGPLWAMFGVGTAAAAKYALGGGGLGGLFGPPPGGPGGPVSREVMELSIKVAKLEADAHADKLNADQAVWNAVQQGRIDCQQKQLDQLFTLTRLTIPNENLTPGVGPVAVVPVPPPAPVAPPAVSATEVVAIVQAVLAAQAGKTQAGQGQSGQ